VTECQDNVGAAQSAKMALDEMPDPIEVFAREKLRLAAF
jgi:hypothetical protein